jgi:ABC-type transporter Mla subunit MlaD
VLRERERKGLATLLHELPQAFADREQLARGLKSVRNASPNLAKGLAALRGERDGDLRRLIANVDSTVDALDDNPAQLIDVVEGGAATFGTTAARSTELQATIERAAAILPNVRTTLHTLDGTLGRADTLLARLNAPAGEVAPALRALRPAVVDTGGLLRSARPLLADLRPATAALARASRDGRPLLDRLQPSIERADDRILPDLAKPDPTTERATYQMIGPTIAGLGSAAANVDQNAHFVALGAGGGERMISTAPCRTYFNDPTAKQIAECEGIAEALNSYLTWRPLPRSKGGKR